MKIKKGETYGAFVKRVRQTAKLTQTEFAHRIGFTSRTISAWEGGANVPTKTEKGGAENG